jgi:hypothetical protein
MALQGPVAATAAHLQAAEDDDFAGFSDDEEDPHLEENHHNELSPPGSPSHSGSDPEDSTDFSDDDVTPPIREVPYRRLGPAESIQELQEQFNEWAREEGFAVIRANGRNKQDGEYSRYDLRCDRYGLPRPSLSVGLRSVASRKCGCKFRATAARSVAGWILHRHTDPASHSHNHGQSLNASSHPQHRKISAETRKTIADLSKHTAIRAREIRAVVSDHDATSVLTRRDIYNARATLRHEALNGRTPSGALIHIFDDMKSEFHLDYRVQWEDDKQTRFLGLVFGFVGSIGFQYNFPELGFIDMTYNTNVQGLPLYHFACITATGQAVNTIFGVIDNEKKESFVFLLQATKELLEAADPPIPDPLVLLTDYCKEMKAAVEEVFPNTQQQICMFHILKNVRLNAAKKFKRPRDPSSDDEEFDDDDEFDNEVLTVTERAALAQRLERESSGVSAVPGPPRKISHDAQGVHDMFQLMVYAVDEPSFFSA